jgi:hypothetical protein
MIVCAGWQTFKMGHIDISDAMEGSSASGASGRINRFAANCLNWLNLTVQADCSGTLSSIKEALGEECTSPLDSYKVIVGQLHGPGIQKGGCLLVALSE